MRPRAVVVDVGESIDEVQGIGPTLTSPDDVLVARTR